MLRLLLVVGFASLLLAAPQTSSAYPGDGGGGSCYRYVCYGPTNCYWAYVC